MKKNTRREDLFQASHLTILFTYSIFSVILTIEAFLMSWETWPLVIIGGGVILCWILHVQQKVPENFRIAIYSALIMFTFFFYGSHTTSVFDTATVMGVVMVLYTMSGIPNLITFLQIVYYVTFAYGIIRMASEGYVFDSLVISRALLHIAAITTVSIVARKVINKWHNVLNSSLDEIDKLTDATDRLNDFLANVSHEIRTPVNAVIGLTGICMENEDDPDKRSSLLAVRNAGRRVAEQVSDILDYSEIDRANLVNNCEDYMIFSVLNDMVSELRPNKPDNLELIIDVDPAIPAMMNTDVSKLKKILHHLITNGLKYTREGGVYVRISASQEEYGVNLQIEVTDTGIGMTYEETERIFERFYQADSGRTRSESGLGLGMAIVQGFVASLGGFIILKSKPGEGTTVHVSLPQKVVDETSCMTLAHRDELCIGAFLHFDKFAHPAVREYYNNMVRNIVKGLGVQMHRVDNAANLKKLRDSVSLTHLFVAAEEYDSAQELLEEMAKDTLIVVVADSGFKLPEGSKVRIMEKPFYCLPVVTILNTTVQTAADEDGKSMYCEGIQALVVDDEPMNLTVARNILQRYGMVVSTAASGSESITMCRANAYDIVFMDHMMPGMDGIEAMKMIRSDKTGKRSDLPIVALTANAVSTARSMFIAEGFDGFVSKPIELIELERVLKNVLPKSAITYRTKAVAAPSAKPSVKPASTPVAAAGTSPSVSASSDTAQTAKPEPVEAKDVKPVEAAQPPETGGGLTDTYARLNACGIDASVGLGYCADDDEFYLQLLTQFVSESGEKLKKIAGFYEAADLANYEILVHALKSNAKMIGIAGLSEHAKELEFAAKEKRSDFIKENNDSVMEEYRQKVSEISDILGISPEESTDDPDDEVLDFAPVDNDEVLTFEPVES